MFVVKAFGRFLKELLLPSKCDQCGEIAYRGGTDPVRPEPGFLFCDFVCMRRFRDAGGR
jgi:hypothetical protein